MKNIAAISRTYDVRALDDADAEAILALCLENTQFYQYCAAEPTIEQVRSDLHITPPGITPSDKYYLGFFQGGALIAVMDLVDGYPKPEIAFIGFFMMKKALQGRNIGSEIIRETAAYLKTAGKTAIRLGIDRDNPQSTHFWKKNGFLVLEETERDRWTILVAERKL